MFLPYTVDVPMERVPLANWVLIGATTLITFGVFFGLGLPDAGDWPDDDIDPAEVRVGRHGSAFDPEPAVTSLALRRDRFALFQLFTYTLVHADVFHLVGNMIFLFCFGNAVNAKLGHAPFLVLYFLLGATAGAVQMLVVKDPLPIVGASGAIMGVVGIFLVLYPRNEVSVLWGWWWGVGGAGTFEIASAWLILMFLGWDLLGTLLAREGGVAYVAHLSGAVAGIMVAAGLVHLGFAPPARGEENLLQLVGLQTADEDDEAERRGKRRAAISAKPRGRSGGRPRARGRGDD
jgi:membrane associated rhomboid family serine protease